MTRIVALDTTDIRFPTSLSLDGSDAMNPDPDYSAAYVIVRTDAEDGIEGTAFVFTIGRANDVQVAGIDALSRAPRRPRARAPARRHGRHLPGDHRRLAAAVARPREGRHAHGIGAVINALWDIKAKRAGLPLWQLLARMTPEELVDLVDFRYLANALTREDALRHPARRGNRAAPSGSSSCSPPGTRGTPRVPAGSDTPTRARTARPRGHGRRLHADQAQGRRRPAGRYPSLPQGA